MSYPNGLNASDMAWLINAYWNPKIAEPTGRVNARTRSFELGLVNYADELGTALTDKGKVFVEAMLSTPIPVSVSVWVIPDIDEVSS